MRSRPHHIRIRPNLVPLPSLILLFLQFGLMEFIDQMTLTQGRWAGVVRHESVGRVDAGFGLGG